MAGEILNYSLRFAEKEEALNESTPFLFFLKYFLSIEKYS